MDIAFSHSAGPVETPPSGFGRKRRPSARDAWAQARGRWPILGGSGQEMVPCRSTLPKDLVMKQGFPAGCHDPPSKAPGR